MPLTPLRLSLRQRLWPALKCICFFVIFAFIARRAFHLWELVPEEQFHVDAFWLILAAFAYCIGWLPSVWFWQSLLRDLRQPLGFWLATRAYYVGHLGKYVPGKALVLVIRASMVKKAGVNPLLAGLAAGYETLVFMATGAAFAIGFGPTVIGESFGFRIPAKLSWLQNYQSLLIPIVFAATLATTPISAWIFTKICRKTVPNGLEDSGLLPAISAQRVSQGVLASSLGWCCHALSLGFVLQSVSTQPFDIQRFPVWLASCTLSTVGGFVILIAPGGLGVREGLLIEALKDQPFIGPKTALITAGLLRAVWFVSELIAAGILWIARPRSPQA